MSQEFLTEVRHRLNRLHELAHTRGFSLGHELEGTIRDMQSFLPNIEASTHGRTVMTENLDRENRALPRKKHMRVLSSGHHQMSAVKHSNRNPGFKKKGVRNKIDSLNQEMNNIAHRVKKSSNEIKMKDSENARLKESIQRLMENMEEHSELFEENNVCSVCTVF